MMNDLKFAFRQLFKRPGGTMIILVTLSLVIGTMSLVLGIVQHQRNAWMPFPESDRVVRLWQHARTGPRAEIVAGIYAEAAGRIQGLEAVGALVNYGPQVMTGEGDPQTLSIAHVSPAVFSVVQVPPILGRVFTEQETKSGAEDLLVISHAFWQSEFDGSADVIGRLITLNEQPVTVIGVMPPGLERNGLFYGAGLDGWMPKDFNSARLANVFVHVVGRRREGVSASQLTAELNTVLAPLHDKWSAPSGRETLVSSFTAQRADWRPGAGLDPEDVFGVAIPVFLMGIAAFNIANILLGRMLVRRHEFAVRFALGARRRRVIRQLIAESLWLALLGSVAGLLMARWVSHWAAAQGVAAEFSPLVLGGTLVFALLTGLVVGWLPAWRATEGDLVTDLKDASGIGNSGSVTRHRLRNFLAIGQVAMAVALCLGAGLLLRSYQNNRSVQLGFDASHLASLSVSLTKELLPEPARRGLYAEQAREQLLAVPGVASVSYTSDRLISRNPSSRNFRLESEGAWRPEQRIPITVISPHHLEQLNVPVLRGRPLQEADRRGSPPVLLVSQSFARQYFPNEDPIGQQIQMALEGGESWLTIVGVTADRPNLGRSDKFGPEGYVCGQQFLPDWTSLVFLIRTTPSPLVLGDAIRQAVQSVDPKVPVGTLFPVEAELGQAMQNISKPAGVVSVVAVLGLLMAMVGIFGVVSYSVTERTYEMGVRMAMGATRRDLIRLVMRQGLRLAGIGLGAGLLLGGMTTIGLRHMLFGISPLDGLTYGGVCLLLLVAALAACWFPALRAARIEPIKALRYE